MRTYPNRAQHTDRKSLQCIVCHMMLLILGHFFTPQPCQSTWHSISLLERMLFFNVNSQTFLSVVTTVGQEFISQHALLPLWCPAKIGQKLLAAF